MIFSEHLIFSASALGIFFNLILCIGLLKKTSTRNKELIHQTQREQLKIITETEGRAKSLIITAKAQQLKIITEAEKRAEALVNEGQRLQLKIIAEAEDNAIAQANEARSKELQLNAEVKENARVIASESERQMRQVEIKIKILEKRISEASVAEAQAQAICAGVCSAQAEIDQLKEIYAAKKNIYDNLISEISALEETLDFSEMGVYKAHFDFTDSEQFKMEIESVRAQQKIMMSNKSAAICTTKWEVHGSQQKGQTFTNRNIKLTLRAFNNECDTAISNVRWNNINVMLKRINNARIQIDKQNVSSTIYLAEEYYQLKLRELKLTHEYREKQKRERDERAEISRIAREELKLIRDIEEAEREEAKYQKMLEKAKMDAIGTQGASLEVHSQRIAMLEQELTEVQAKVVRAQSMAEMTKSGYIYIISNVGSFGADMVKIGLTRRLDPTDRIRELGSASVPFLFDTHAIIYSDEAPALEKALHNEFSKHRVNATNMRKEFFRVSLDDVEAAIKRLAPEASFFGDIEAQEYHETISLRNEQLQTKILQVQNVFPDTL